MHSMNETILGFTQDYSYHKYVHELSTHARKSKKKDMVSRKKIQFLWVRQMTFHSIILTRFTLLKFHKVQNLVTE